MIISSAVRSQDAPHLGSSSDKTRSADVANDYSQEPFVYENVRGKLRYESDGTGVREISARIRVQSALGLQKVGQLVFDYNAANESVEIRSVRVIKPDGSIVVTNNGPETVQDLSAPVAREAPMYTDARQKHVTVAGLGVGDIVEYEVITTTTKPLIANEFWQTWNFVSDAICLDEQVDLDVPRDRALKVKAPPDVISNMRDDGGRRLYHWSTSTLKYSSVADVLKRSKFDVATLLEGARPAPPRQILFSTFDSWSDIGRWYSETAKDRRAVTPEIQNEADTIAKGASTDSAKAQALYSWVAANIRYVSLSFGLGRYQPHAASEVLANRYGDCKDKSTLLEALLKAEGLDADPVLVNSAHDIDPDVPSPLQFDHVITLLHLQGKDVWLDSTVGVGPYGYLLPQLRGKNALIASARAAGGLQTTPSKLQIPTTYRILIQDGSGNDGKVNLRLALDTRGDVEVLLRLGFLQLPAEQMTNLINQNARSANNATGDDFSFHDLRTSDPMNTVEPFHIEASISGTPTKETGAGKVQESLSELRKSLVSLLPEAPLNSKGSDAQSVELGEPKELFLTMESASAVAPGDSVPRPDSVHVEEDFATFDNTGEWDGKAFRATWHLDLKSSEVSSNRFDEYNKFRQKVLGSFDTNSSAVAFLLEARVAKSPDDGNAYLDLGNSYLSMHKFEPAVRSLEKATELLPGNEAAQLSLGRAYLGAGQTDKAMNTFERMIAMDHGPVSLNNAAYYLGEQKVHMDTAEKWSRAAIKDVEEQLNQSDVGALKQSSAQLTGNLAADWDTFGWLKFREGDYNAAEKYVRAAWEIANYTEVGCHLGLIYQTMGRKDDAIETYAETLALVGTLRQLSENETEARHQLGVLLGDDSLIQGKLQEARSRLGSWRSIHVDNPSHVSGSARFILIVGPGSKIEDIEPVQQKNPVNDLEANVRAATMPQTFPDGGIRKLPRAGTLSCSSPTGPCTFTLLPPVPAAQVFATLTNGSAE